MINALTVAILDFKMAAIKICAGMYLIIARQPNIIEIQVNYVILSINDQGIQWKHLFCNIINIFYISQHFIYKMNPK